MASPTIIDASRSMAKKKMKVTHKLSAKQRQALPRSDFALPGKGKGPKGAGAGSYPINDPGHAKAALSRVAQHGTPAEKAEVRRKVHEKYPNMGEKRKKLYDNPRSRPKE